MVVAAPCWLMPSPFHISLSKISGYIDTPFGNNNHLTNINKVRVWTSLILHFESICSMLNFYTFDIRLMDTVYLPGCSLAIVCARAGLLPPTLASTAFTRLLHVGFPNFSTWRMRAGDRTANNSHAMLL